ncbi:hypothetical protein A2642_02400 [Candidatus Nomurabacteria bacterium RIFCSPHIGHO2_01_FULL_39_10]|uniref:Uncharacterized protein n=1 Tax=Candidatus Nomurabacteria bacterium RIFCSPHIGHO2_01_FULL_39_10 TaxID=1801733 RepID=A0A1F6V589_9BACT|nr:MAG: hypothetical protein A2642_02400 [Candidatus Nomurabacteria bacterium RIFCSPHIGHO2_01_FULL_39_10]
MKIQAQPHTFAFQTPQQFKEAYLQLYLGTEFEQYQQLNQSLTATDIATYQTQKETLEEYNKQKQAFIRKVQQNSATPQEYETQQQIDVAIKEITLDGKITKYFSIQEKISTPYHRAARVRNNYITQYNPKDRNILLIHGENGTPSLFSDLANILRADGGLVTQSNYHAIPLLEKPEPTQIDTTQPESTPPELTKTIATKTDTQDNNAIDDIIYTAFEICGRNDGKETWPILRHAEKNDGFTLFFLSDAPLHAHCQNDPELKYAKELHKQHKKIFIMTDNYYCPRAL